MIGEDIAAAAYDDSGTEARGALRLLRDLVAEEAPENRIIQQWVPRRLDFLGREDVDDRRRGAAHRFVEGADLRSNRLRAGGGTRLYDRERCASPAGGQPFRPERRDHEQRRNGDRDGLRENQPEATHGIAQYTKFLCKFKRLEAKS